VVQGVGPEFKSQDLKIKKVMERDMTHKDNGGEHQTEAKRDSGDEEEEREG
jgi:hypothetical protein